jgi:hypothetical protein
MDPVDELDINATDGRGKDQAITVVGPLGEVHDEDLFKLQMCEL